MPDFLKQFDGTGRKPREGQIAFLKWLDENWRHQFIAGQLPVGEGKSALANAIRVVTGAHIITPSNVLIDQYRADYPDQNYLKGKEHYICSVGVSCSDWQNVAEQEACPDCPYTDCRSKAVKGIPTFFNPMSLYYTSQDRNYHKPDVIVVDEAHQLAGMIQLLSGTKLRFSEYHYPSNADNERVLVAWLDDQIRRLRKMATFYKKDPQRLAEITQELERLRLTYRGFSEDAQNYVVYTEAGRYRGRPDNFLHIKPINPPRKLVSEILNATKVILLSGTLLDHDLAGLLSDSPRVFYDAPSAIPIANRSISYQPAPFRLSTNSNPKQLADLIWETYVRKGRPNTIAHVSYAVSRKLHPLLSDRAIFNSAEDKYEAVQRFQSEGGLFIAAGCAEGLDLKDDQCRLNLIPQLLFPNLGDPVVKKRKSLQDGEDWYALETLKTTIQQAGRSTRGPKDWSKTIIMDPHFPWVFKRVKNKLPKSFTEAILWSGD